MALADLLISETKLINHPYPERLHKDVSSVHKTLKHVLPLIGFQVEENTALVTIKCEKEW
jgi:hypothetical protein